MLQTLNGGIVKNIDGLDVEILSHHFHNPKCDILCTYFLDEDYNKVELTYYKYIKTGNSGYEIYKCKNADDIHFYWSRDFNENNLPKKYQEIAKKLIKIHDSINFDEYKEREKK